MNVQVSFIYVNGDVSIFDGMSALEELNEGSLNKYLRGIDLTYYYPTKLNNGTFSIRKDTVKYAFLDDSLQDKNTKICSSKEEMVNIVKKSIIALNMLYNKMEYNDRAR